MSNILPFKKPAPKNVYEEMVCLFCGTRQTMVHPDTGPNTYHGPCAGCDETANVPLWRLRIP